MERALDLGILTEALAGRTGIPSAQELQQLMGQMEVQLFLRRPELDPQLLDAAWYLHAIASVNEARNLYTPQRQRRAFAISAHIFDLALQHGEGTSQERLSLGFAAAIGYRRGDRDPNATAILHRLQDLIIVAPPVEDHAGTLPLEAGLAFLGFQPRSLFKWFAAWRRQLAAVARMSALDSLNRTVFGPGELIVFGADDLLAYFTNGDAGRLARGRERLLRVINGDRVPEDLDARWVAAHLLALSREAEAGSLWNPRVMPPSVPPLVRQAFTLGSPAVLTLWEPQRELLTREESPFDPQVRRMVLSVPTSSGKTLMAQLLAVEQLERTSQAVCYVAPTRSLCREVRGAMSSRVRILQKETDTDVPDFPTGIFGLDLFDVLDPGPPPEVAVMTPERLSNLLRHDADEVLTRFGLFIFDEAQLIKEAGRGFVVESTIAVLDFLTRGTDHRLVLISAAMGNAGTIAQWISPDRPALLQESSWRGPRRLHAVFTSEARWTTTTVEQIRITRATVWPYRHITELGGLVRLRLAEGRVEELRTDGDTGWRFVRKAKSDDRYPQPWEKDQGKSTPQYVMATDMMLMLGHAGSVLVVASTRGEAQSLAVSLARKRDPQVSLTPLAGFVESQLGPDHPLVACLRHGVGFHHAGLPTEVQEALEQAVRDDVLPYLTCTSTLTDGINLPVRTVVIYDLEYEGQPEDIRLRGARLVNAIGRAGRAGKETEGWIVLVRAKSPSPRDFTDLDPDADALAVTSSLITDEALHELAELEEKVRADEDEIFRETARAARDFVSFIWLMLKVQEEHGIEPEDADVAGFTEATLAGQQSASARGSFLVIADAVRNRYAASPSPARRRWPQTGTSIGTARTLDDLATAVTGLIMFAAAPADADALSRPEFLMQYPEVIGELLSLPEAPNWRFRVTPQGDNVNVATTDVLRDWLQGVSVPELADLHLEAVTSPAWRVEQMVDAVARHFEHYLSWTAGALVELVNWKLSDANFTGGQLCPDLGGYIRYGVDDPAALTLMGSGIRSRRLAHLVAADLPDEVLPSQDGLRTWLAGMSIADWRERYAAEAPEILDLLEFTRRRRRSLVRQLLETGSVTVEPLMLSVPPASPARLTVQPLRDAVPPAPLAVYSGNDQLGTIASQDHTDVAAILDTGLAITYALDTTGDATTLVIALPLADAA